MRLCEWNQLTETENQKVARYVSGLKQTIQDRIGLQNLWSLQEAINMALKAEQMDKEKRQTSYRRVVNEQSDYSAQLFECDWKWRQQGAKQRAKPKSTSER